MVIRQIVQLVKDNFATCKHYHLKLSTRKKATGNSQNKIFKFSTHKTHLATCKNISLNLQLEKRNSQFAKSNLQLVILFPTRKITLQLVKRSSQLVNLFP